MRNEDKKKPSQSVCKSTSLIYQFYCMIQHSMSFRYLPNLKDVIYLTLILMHRFILYVVIIQID
jgi:hypothetical protein